MYNRVNIGSGNICSEMVHALHVLTLIMTSCNYSLENVWVDMFRYEFALIYDLNAQHSGNIQICG